MRALSKWSASSLSTTVPRPCQGEPSRRIAHLLGVGRVLLEEARVDRIEAWIVDGKPRERAVRRHHGAGRFGAHIVIGGHLIDVAGLADAHDARDGAEPRREVDRKSVV